MTAAVSITNLAEFRRDLKAASSSMPRELTKALRLAGIPVAEEAKSLAPVRSGALAGGYKVQVSGTIGRIISSVPYAGGAEWGQRGKWKGFMRYGAAGARFAGRAIDDQADRILADVARGLQDIISLHGWAR